MIRAFHKCIFGLDVHFRLNFPTVSMRTYLLLLVEALSSQVLTQTFVVLFWLSYTGELSANVDLSVEPACGTVRWLIQQPSLPYVQRDFVRVKYFLLGFLGHRGRSTESKGGFVVVISSERSLWSRERFIYMNI